MLQKHRVKLVPKSHSWLVSTHSSRPFSSEFKRYFGFDNDLETTKIRNDENTDSDNSRKSSSNTALASLSK